MERFYRRHASQLQTVYDWLPSPLHTVLTSVRGVSLRRIRYAGAMHAELGELLQHDRWTEEDQRREQQRLLRSTIEQARAHVPFYAAYPALDERAGLDSFPVLSRETVRAHAAELCVSGRTARKRVEVATTGTTGASLKVAYGAEVMRTNWAFRMRQWAWAGLTPGLPRVTFFGSRVTPPGRRHPPYWVHNLAERQTLMSIFHLSPEAAPAYIAELRRRGGQVLEGFPSVLGIMADFILEAGEPVPMRAVFCDGEPLYPFLREKIERAFSTRILDSYGNTENCGLIQECEAGGMHLATDYAMLEILDEDDRPVARGQEGFFVWTGFTNTTMPLVRYRIGDRGCWDDRSCPCGRVFPLVRPTITRESDLLHARDGRVFSPRALNQLLKGSTAFRFCQFVQRQPEQVIVRAVAGQGAAAEQLASVRERLESLLGAGMQVVGQLAQDPIVRAGGKIPLIVRGAQ